MNMEPYVENIRRQLEVAAGDDVLALAERLVSPLEAAIRLALQDALAAAAEEITLDLAPGSVELRLRGRDLEFVVVLPPVEMEDTSEGEGILASGWRLAGLGPRTAAEGEEPTLSRINLRLPERLKSRVEEAAASEGLSVNTWLVRASAVALERADIVRRRDRRAPQGAQRYTGWAR